MEGKKNAFWLFCLIFFPSVPLEGSTSSLCASTCRRADSSLLLGCVFDQYIHCSYASVGKMRPRHAVMGYSILSSTHLGGLKWLPPPFGGRRSAHRSHKLLSVLFSAVLQSVRSVKKAGLATLRVYWRNRRKTVLFVSMPVLSDKLLLVWFAMGKRWKKLYSGILVGPQSTPLGSRWKTSYFLHQRGWWDIFETHAVFFEELKKILKHQGPG